MVFYGGPWSSNADDDYIVLSLDDINVQNVGVTGNLDAPMTHATFAKRPDSSNVF